MSVIVGMCLGAILTIVAIPIIINVLMLVAWALGFVDMGLNPKTPDWLKRLRKDK